jgi:hypothetical protein
MRDCASSVESNPQLEVKVMATLEEVGIGEELDQEILNSSTDDIINRSRLLENDIKVSFYPGITKFVGDEIRASTTYP